MASMLRSGKFFRLFSNLTRSFDLSAGGRNNNEFLLCARRGEWEINIHRSLSAAHLPLKNFNDSAQQSLISTEKDGVDKAIEKAESDAKKSGRITKDDILDIIEKIKQQKTASTTQSLLLIRCCGNLVPEEPPNLRTKLVEDVWKMFEGFGVPLDVSHYNALLRVYLENEHSFDPMKFIKILEGKSIEPNRVTYQRLLSAYCQKGDIDGASQILEIMKSKDLPIGEQVFNSLVMGHANTGDLESAKGVIKVMSQAGLEPDGETYRALLCGYAKHGHLQDITSTISECKSKEIVIYDRSLMEVLYTAAVHGHSAIVDDLLKQMNRSSGYNQDCFNIILRLINHQQEDHAFKILKTMKPTQLANGQMSQTGNFFIKQIIKSNCSPQKVISICDQLVESGLNNRAYFKALELSNAHGKTDISNLILKRIQRQKKMLRPSSFWPLLTAQSKVSGEKGVLDALRQMAAIQVMPNIDTISHHVLPHMAKENVETLLRKLRSADVPPSVVAISLIVQSLKNQDFKSAIEIASKIFTRSESMQFRQAACEAYLKTRDASSVAKLIKSMLRQSEPGAENEARDQAAGLAGPLIIEIFDRAPNPKLEAVEPLLKAMQENGISLPLGAIQHIQEKASEEMTDSVAQLLVELGSGKLPLTDILPFPSDSNKGNQAKSVIAFVEFVKQNNLEKALNEKKYLESNKFVFSKNLKVLLMDLYVRNERVDDALVIFNEIYEGPPDFILTSPKVLSLATSLLKCNRTEEAFKVLERLNISTDKKQENGRSDIFSWRLMDVAASKGDVDLTSKLFEVVLQSGMKITGMVASALVKVHIVKEDNESAVKAFLDCVEKYRITPFKGALTVRLIEMEDAQRLQQVMDASIKVHGEMNSLYDLVFSFLECGRIRQAKKVLETPGLRAMTNRIEMACARYVEDMRITELENLIKITKDVYGIDRNMMFKHMLSACIKSNDVARASGLWTQMQEEDMQANPEFLQRLGNFLKEKNESVPFTIPESSEIVTSSTPASSVTATMLNLSTSESAHPSVTGKKTSGATEPQNTTIKEFGMALKNGDINAAMELKKKIESQGNTLNKRYMNNLIEAAVKGGALDVATQLVLELEKKGEYPLIRIFKFLMSALVSSGDQKAIRTIGECINEERKALLSYENQLASSIACDPVATTDYVEALLNKVKTASAESNLDEKQLNGLKTAFPEGGIIGILEKNPNVLSKCQEIANEARKLGLYGPTNSLWCYFMKMGNTAEAQSTWEILKSYTGAIKFQSILRQIRKDEDIASAENLVKTLASSEHVKPSALGVAYSAWLDVLRSKKELDSSIALVNKALSEGVEVLHFNQSALTSLEAECKNAGKSFPFLIPKSSEKSEAQSKAD